MEIDGQIAALVSQVHQVTFGTGLPGWEVGCKTDPSIILVQEWLVTHNVPHVDKPTDLELITTTDHGHGTLLVVCGRGPTTLNV